IVGQYRASNYWKFARRAMSGLMPNASKAVTQLPDQFWCDVAAFLNRQNVGRGVILAPNDFLPLFAGTLPITIRRAMVPTIEIEYYVIHKGMFERSDPIMLREAVAHTPVFANEVFAVYSPRGKRLAPDDERHLKPVNNYVNRLPTDRDRYSDSAAVVTTFNRPWALRRTLRSLSREFRHVLVVDDGSQPLNAFRNKWIARKARATYLRVPYNLGNANGITVGVSHWLAHPEVAWISAFNDDVDVVPGTGDVLARVARASPFAMEATLISGFFNPYHPPLGETELAGRRVLFARSTSGHHLHAHRNYWAGVLPIPTQYFRAPKPVGGLYPGQGCDTDWWIGSWAPRSCVKQGGEIIVVPGLIENFGAGASTWGGTGY
ncbi:MAG: glycosyltransferase family 2 protein, partial [Alphaproteobacteria bacterium]